MSVPRRDTTRSISSLQTTGGNIKRSSTASTQASVSIPTRQPQIVDDRYLDEDKLKAYLDKHYPDQWKIQVKLGKWLITAPKDLSPEILDTLCD